MKKTITNENNIKDKDNFKGKDNIDYVRKVCQVRRDPELHQIVSDYNCIEQQVIALKDKKSKKKR